MKWYRLHSDSRSVDAYMATETKQQRTVSYCTCVQARSYAWFVVFAFHALRFDAIDRWLVEINDNVLIVSHIFDGDKNRLHTANCDQMKTTKTRRGSVCRALSHWDFRHIKNTNGMAQVDRHNGTDRKHRTVTVARLETCLLEVRWSAAITITLEIA